MRVFHGADGTITIVTLPSTGAGLRLSEQGLQSVLSACALTLGGLLLLGGRAADLPGRRRVFMAGFRPAAATRPPGPASQPSGRQSKGPQKGGEPGVLLSCQPGRQGPATRDASPGQPAAPETTGPCADQGISACRTSPTAGPRDSAQGTAAARRTRAMTPLPAGHARPHRVPAHPGSSPAPCRAERLRRPMVRRRSAGSGRRLTIRRRQHTHPTHRAVDQNGGSSRDHHETAIHALQSSG